MHADDTGGDDSEKALLERIQLFRNFNEVLLQQIKFSPRDYEVRVSISSCQRFLIVAAAAAPTAHLRLFVVAASQLPNGFPDRFFTTRAVPLGCC